MSSELPWNLGVIREAGEMNPQQVFRRGLLAVSVQPAGVNNSHNAWLFLTVCFIDIYIYILLDFI